MANEELVMNKEQRRQYTFDRKLYDEPDKRERQLNGLREVIMHDGFTTAQVETGIGQFGHGTPEKYYPRKSKEAHFYVPQTGQLHVVNTRGFTRLERDRDQVDVLAELLGRDIGPRIYHYKKSAAAAGLEFRRFAYDVVDEVFSNIDLEAITKKCVVGEQQKKQCSISLICGPHESLILEPEDVLRSSSGNYSDYLEWRILQGNIINLDYVFAEQAEHVLDQIYLRLNALAIEKDIDFVDLNVFHYGKIGALNHDPTLKVGRICVPVSSLDESRIQKGRARKVPIENELAEETDAADVFRRAIGYDSFVGTTVNTVSVMQQTHKRLTQDLEAGGDFLDMEWSRLAALALNGSVRIRNTRLYFAGVVSDKPLEGLTLADTEYPAGEEAKVAQAFMKIIQST